MVAKIMNAKIDFDEESIVWTGFTAEQKKEIQYAMRKMGIRSPEELVQIAVLEYAETIKNNPERWKYERSITC